MNVTVYSTTTCPYCLTLKNYLKEKNISFTEKLIDQDDSAKEEMKKESGGFMGVPFTVVSKEDGSKETVVGFDKRKLNQVLGLE
jgi:glutaredoxin 3